MSVHAVAQEFDVEVRPTTACACMLAPCSGPWPDPDLVAAPAWQHMKRGEMQPHLQVHTITADRVVGGFTGQSERQLREAFAEAEEAAAAGKRVVRAVFSTRRASLP